VKAKHGQKKSSAVPRRDGMEWDEMGWDGMWEAKMSKLEMACMSKGGLVVCQLWIFPESLGNYLQQQHTGNIHIYIPTIHSLYAPFCEMKVLKKKTLPHYLFSCQVE
jgi:hypothetical protein